MGYLSDVSITMHQDDFDNLVRRAITESNEDALNLIKQASLYKDDEKNIITILWNFVKWYKNYNDVDFVMSFIRDGDVQYHFVRVGEEMGDIEEEYNDDDWSLYGAANAEQYINIDQAGENIDNQFVIDNIIRQCHKEVLDK